MEAKGCAKPMVWKNARRHFYWSLRARLARDQKLSEMMKANPNLTNELAMKQLNTLLSGSTEPRSVAEELEKLNLDSTIAQMKNDYVAQQLTTLATQDRKALISGVSSLLGSLSEDERASVLLALHSTRPTGEQF